MKKRIFEYFGAKANPRLKLWLAGIAVAGFIAFYWDAKSSVGPKDVREPEDVATAATYIPEGFVLVPIEVANYESLDSILGKFGVVDLYVPHEDPKRRPVKIAERIKILRAPLNPSHFAVLAPESESSRLVKHAGPFTVVVQHPGKSGTKFVNQADSGQKPPGTSRARSSRITFEVGNVVDNPEEP